MHFIKKQVCGIPFEKKIKVFNQTSDISVQSPAFIYKLCHLIWECGTITIGYFKVNLGVHVVYMTGAWTDIRILHNAPDFPKYSRTWKSTITVQNRYALMLLTTPNRSSVVTGQGKGLFLFFFLLEEWVRLIREFRKKGNHYNTIL